MSSTYQIYIILAVIVVIGIKIYFLNRFIKNKLMKDDNSQNENLNE